MLYIDVVLCGVYREMGVQGEETLGETFKGRNWFVYPITSCFFLFTFFYLYIYT